jgi:hypothetical protein
VFDQTVLTPNDRFFVRWHWALIPTAVNVDTFRLTVRGHVKQTLSLSLNDILAPAAGGAGRDQSVLRQLARLSRIRITGRRPPTRSRTRLTQRQGREIGRTRNFYSGGASRRRGQGSIRKSVERQVALSGPPSVTPDDAHQPLQEGDEASLKRVMREVPRGALALAGLTVGFLLLAWFLIFSFVFLPRGMVG